MRFAISCEKSVIRFGQRRFLFGFGGDRWSGIEFNRNKFLKWRAFECIRKIVLSRDEPDSAAVLDELNQILEVGVGQEVSADITEDHDMEVRQFGARRK